MLVERNERTKSGRRKEREDDAVARAVTLEHLRLDESLGSLRTDLLTDLLLRLAESQGFGLSEEVTE